MPIESSLLLYDVVDACSVEVLRLSWRGPPLCSSKKVDSVDLSVIVGWGTMSSTCPQLAVWYILLYDIGLVSSGIIASWARHHKIIRKVGNNTNCSSFKLHHNRASQDIVSQITGMQTISIFFSDIMFANDPPEHHWCLMDKSCERKITINSSLVQKKI